MSHATASISTATRDGDHAEEIELAILHPRDEAFEAIFKLWLDRKKEGLSHRALAEKLGRDPAWISRMLSGPTNWTMKTLGELAYGLRGRVKISVEAIEAMRLSNFDIYADLNCTPSSGRAIQTIHIIDDFSDDYAEGRFMRAVQS